MPNYGKMVVKFELSLQEGLNFLKLPVEKRVHNGTKVNRPSAKELFANQHNNLVCSCCGLRADRWIAAHQSRKDKSIWLNLFGVKDDEVILFTRDHIIPRAFGGSDDIRNMRVMCRLCNTARSTQMSEEDLDFLEANHGLIHLERYSAMVERQLKPKFKFANELKGIVINIDHVLPTMKQIIKRLGERVVDFYPTLLDDYRKLTNTRNRFESVFQTSQGDF